MGLGHSHASMGLESHLQVPSAHQSRAPLHATAAACHIEIIQGDNYFCKTAVGGACLQTVVSGATAKAQRVASKHIRVNAVH